jgi:hypothetical protein
VMDPTCVGTAKQSNASSLQSGPGFRLARSFRLVLSAGSSSGTEKGNSPIGRQQTTPACPIFIPKHEPRKAQHATGSFFIRARVESIIAAFAPPLLLRETQASEAIKQLDGTLIVSGKLLALLVNSQRASWPSACPQVLFDHFIRWMNKILLYHLCLVILTT